MLTLIRAVKPGGRIYTGAIQHSTFGDDKLPLGIRVTLDILTARDLSCTIEHEPGTGFVSWAYPLLTDYYSEDPADRSSHLIVNVGY